MTRVTLGKSRVRESCMPGSVRAKAEWLSYSTSTQPGGTGGAGGDDTVPDQLLMNRFRKLDFIEYNGGPKVHSSLLNIVVHD